MTAPRNESPSSPRTRDRIDVAPISTEARDALHAHADATGRTIGDIAAQIIERHAGDEVRRVVAVVFASKSHWVVDEGGDKWTPEETAVKALSIALFLHPGARIEDAGPRRYEVVL